MAAALEIEIEDAVLATLAEAASFSNMQAMQQLGERT